MNDSTPNLISVQPGTARDVARPKRIQRKRTKGWKMPANAVYVGRPTKWGNPYPTSKELSIEESLIQYEGYISSVLRASPDFLVPLKGKDLACWCPLDQRCHADILLEVLYP